VRPEEQIVITPTIGRIVWFYPATYKPGEQPLAALVTYVWNERMVNLAVFDANGRHVDGTTSVRLVQPQDERPQSGYYCTWMPYQVGQAQKTEQLEQQLATRNPMGG
jgi:hypothetical protein